MGRRLLSFHPSLDVLTLLLKFLQEKTFVCISLEWMLINMKIWKSQSAKKGRERDNNIVSNSRGRSLIKMQYDLIQSTEKVFLLPSRLSEASIHSYSLVRPDIEVVQWDFFFFGIIKNSCKVLGGASWFIKKIFFCNFW